MKKKPTIQSPTNNGFRLQLKSLVANKIKRFPDDISKTWRSSNITEEWLYNRLKKLLLPGNYIACETCGMSMNFDSITLDHKVPRSMHKQYLGNIHDVDNLNIICPACNSLKGQRTLQEFLEILKQRNESIIELHKQYRNNNNPPIIAPLYPDVGIGCKLFGADHSYKKLKK